MIEIEEIDHIGIRVADLGRAMEFYGALGFEIVYRNPEDPVAVIKNDQGVELNLVHNAGQGTGEKNILMDVDEKYPGITHVALKVRSLKDAMETLDENGIRISQGPVVFNSGNVSVFVRDPDLNVVELRGDGAEKDALPGVRKYEDD